MTLNYRHDGQGGFAVRLAGTNISCYAYPSSEHATAARKNGAKVAEKMMAAEIAFLPTAVEVLGYRRAMRLD